jgi:hypothetical protein
MKIKFNKVSDCTITLEDFKDKDGQPQGFKFKVRHKHGKDQQIVATLATIVPIKEGQKSPNDQAFFGIARYHRGDPIPFNRQRSVESAIHRALRAWLNVQGIVPPLGCNIITRDDELCGSTPIENIPLVVRTFMDYTPTARLGLIEKIALDNSTEPWFFYKYDPISINREKLSSYEQPSLESTSDSPAQ